MKERVVNVAKWSRNVSMAIVLGIFLAGCGDDDSSFDPRDEDSSSSVCEDCDDASSSSVRSSSSAPVEDLSSSSARSSSSAPVEDLSSSSVKSSSSAKSSSSVIPASSGDLQSSSSNKQSSSSARSSSSSAKSSSSSAKSSSSSAESSSSSAKSSSSVSSSSEYVPYNHLVDMGDGIGTYVKKQDYKTFTDERNDRSYYYITIRGKNSKKEVDSVTVMAENLNIGKMIGSGLDQANDTLIERYCYDRDTTNCDRYGGLYQWAEMMQLPSRCNTESCADLIQENHQGICPDGWRLLTQEDFYIVMHADNNEHGIEDVRARGFGGYNYTGYSLVGAGYVWNRRLSSINEGTYWFYPEENAENPDTKAAAAAGAQLSDLIVTKASKLNGFSVRCVKMD